MKKYKRLLILTFILASAALAVYFSFRLFRLESEPERPEVPVAPVARVIQINFSGPDGLAGWNRHSFHGETKYEIHDEADGTKSLKASSQNACSALFKPVGVSLSEKPVLSWQWKVKKFPSGKKNEVFGAKDESDFAARVSVIFKSELPLQQDIVQYVWDDHFPAGTRGTSPFWKKVKILVVRSGPPPNPEEWVSEKRDIVQDYTLLFGKPPEKDIEAIGLMSDSDDTKSATEAYFRSFEIQTLYSEEEPEKPARKPLLPRMLRPVFKKTRSFFKAFINIPAKTIPRVVSTTERIPRAVVSTTKKVVEPVIRRTESK